MHGGVTKPRSMPVMNSVPSVNAPSRFPRPFKLRHAGVLSQSRGKRLPTR